MYQTLTREIEKKKIANLINLFWKPVFGTDIGSQKTVISVPTVLNGKGGVRPKVVRLFWKFPFEPRVSFELQKVGSEISAPHNINLD